MVKRMPDEMTLLDTSHGVYALENGRLVEAYAAGGDTLVGAIYVGRVERVLPKLEAAFVDIGEEKMGFLPLKEAGSYQQQQPGERFCAGSAVVVQVKKDPKGDKGAFLTRDWSLVGQGLLLMPCNRYLGVSRRVTEESERALLLLQAKALAGSRCGLVMRHSALHMSESELQSELEALAAEADALQKRAPMLKPPVCLRREPSMTEVLKREYGARGELNLLTDEDAEAFFRAQGVQRQLDEALERKVRLPNGGTLVIDEREALTTIDVNTAAYVGGSGGQIALEQNRAACAEIARQIRLRGLGGIILIDWIDMPSDEARQQVSDAFAAELQRDRVKTVVHGFTRLGLMEMTRKRTTDTLLERMTAPCPACGGSGRARNEGEKA